MATGILFAVLTGISWIWVGIVISYAARNKVNIPYIQLLQTLTGITISVIVLFAMGMLMKEQPEISARTKWLTAFCMITFGILNYFMFLAMGAAMRRGPNGIVWSVIQSGIVFPFLMGILIFHVEPTLSRVGGMLLIVGSVILFGLGKEKKAAANVPGMRKNSWYFFALLGMLLCGLNQCCANLPSYLSNGEPVGSVYRACFSQVGMLSGWLIGAVTTHTLSPPEIPSGRVEKDPVFCDLTQCCWADGELSFVLQCARFSGGSWGGVARVSAGGELLHHRIFPLQRDLSEGKDRNFSEERIHFRRRGNRHHLPVEEPGNLSGKRFGDYNGEFRFRL